MSMINTKDILETIKMIEEEHLDIRTITMGISLRDLAADDINVLADKVYDKVTRRAEKLVATGEQTEENCASVKDSSSSPAMPSAEGLRPSSMP